VKGTRGDEGPQLTKLQGFTVERINRGAIKNAPYNPRIMQSYERADLARFIRKMRLLGPITWNRLTGNIVGGHQRMAILDAYEKKSGYLLDVAVVELTDAQEIEANIGLNNANMQGSYDFGKLESLLGRDATHKIDAELVGFKRPQLEEMFGPTFFSSGKLEAQVAQATAASIAEVQQMMPPKGEKKAPQSAKERRAEMKAEIAESHEPLAAHRIVIFEKWDRAAKLMELLGYEGGEVHIDGEKLLARLGAE